MTEIESLTSEGWDKEIYRQFQTHASNEDELLDAYRKLAEGIGSSDVTYLAKMIIEDETRHHQLFKELAASAGDPTWNRSRSDIPYPPIQRSNPDEFRAATDRLLEFERKDEKQLRQLRRDLKQAESTTIWPLLVDWMILDTRKHIAVLKQIKRLAKGIRF